MQPLAKAAINRIDELNFYPLHYKKIYLHWLNNIQDWCISRQIWWGHQIPAYHCQNCHHIIIDDTLPFQCQKCLSSHFIKDPDVLDTWFSSWLWSFVAGYNHFPQSLIVSGSDILFFWIARMIMASLFFTDKTPFHDIYLHGIIRDNNNKKMSKSTGNVINPLSMIETIGADALRDLV